MCRRTDGRLATKSGRTRRVACGRFGSLTGRRRLQSSPVTIQRNRASLRSGRRSLHLHLKRIRAVGSVRVTSFRGREDHRLKRWRVRRSLESRRPRDCLHLLGFANDVRAGADDAFGRARDTLDAFRRSRQALGVLRSVARQAFLVIGQVVARAALTAILKMVPR